jgi:hypothetical protein
MDRVIKDMKGKTIARNKRRGILSTLGYDWHPALSTGKAPKATGVDAGGRPRLYVERDGALWNPFGDPAAILREYEAAQLAG